MSPDGIKRRTGRKPAPGGHVVPGSGTDELTGLSGTVEIAVSDKGGHSIVLQYQLPDNAG